ncbi:MAG: oxygen-insensitive NAD(P)H nitroreductase, partial [Acinetobacter sp.]|nr:oxygen-insensitive NAD(P)H nitroreductase [Acinetobacter sp.]
CKAYDANRQIPSEQLQYLLDVLRLAPSSLNTQPWQFLVAQSAASKAKISQAMQGTNTHNATKITNCSAVIIFCVQQQLGINHLQKVLDAEQAAGRFATDEAKQQRQQHCLTYLQQKQNHLAAWTRQQCYIALGQLLLATQEQGIDATPIEGFDSVILDDILQLPAQGLNSVVVVALGYHSEQDFNHGVPKGRLAQTDIVQFLDELNETR